MSRKASVLKPVIDHLGKGKKIEAITYIGIIMKLVEALVSVINALINSGHWLAAGGH